ncbi:hypothetical protein F909_00697 [Acinetobacter sp. ANC 3929]|uniref:hypothetical protein n=1 Tax=Acinetobacter sp. ANC 3929 TaxID=1217707 RepID=UPI0002CEFAC6|nr:hypothetical protein [Acinetobacter sp. ANC 3929]ENW83106.1 hypothetical protein F909_00697 [Acinetobacter sp. ANC 3929]
MKKIISVLQLSEEEKKLILFLELFGQRLKNISAYELWVMKQLICQFGIDSVSLPLEKLAKQIGVQHKKLREVLAELERVELIELSFPGQRERARVRHIKLVIQTLNSDFNDPNSLDEQLTTTYKKMQRYFPLFQFIKILFTNTSEIKVTNKAEIAQQNNFFDFRSCLVLFALLSKSDAFGFVFDCGMPEIMLCTGLTNRAVSRAIKQLKEVGMIRSQANGAIGNSFIQLEAPVYALNLSHAFWGEGAIYGNFYILKYPEPHVFEVQKIASLFNLFQEASLKKENIDHSKTINILKKENSYLLKDPLCWMNSEHERRVFQDVQNFEVSQLFQFYTELDELPIRDKVLKGLKIDGKHDVFCENNKEQVHIQENNKGQKGDAARFTPHGRNDRFGLLQCVLEQWCARIYSQDRLLREGLMAQNRSEIREDHITRLDVRAYLEPYELDEKAIQLKFNNVLTTQDQKDQITAKPFDLGRERTKWMQMSRARISQFLMKVMDLIAYNQISFLSKFLEYRSKEESEKKEEFLDYQVSHRIPLENLSFRIMPRSLGQTGSTCFFIMDRTATANQYFVGYLEICPLRNDFPMLDEISKLSPTLEQLKEFGLLPVSCMAETEAHAVPSEDRFDDEKLAHSYSDLLSTLASK